MFQILKAVHIHDHLRALKTHPLKPGHYNDENIVDVGGGKVKTLAINPRPTLELSSWLKSE